MSRVSLTCPHCEYINPIAASSFDSTHQCSHCNKAITDGCVMPILSHNLNVITKSRLPLVIYFWGANCSNCKILMPIVEQVAKQYIGKYRFASVYVPKNMPLAKRYRVRGVPSMVLLKKGKQQAFINGGLRQKELLQWINSNT